MFKEKDALMDVAWWHAAREGIWGMLAGLVGSLCCIGPSAAILLGLGSSSVLFGIQINRTLALGAGLTVLIVGTVLALRRTRTCAVHPRVRWRQIVLMLATGTLAYGLLGVLAPWAATRQEEASAASIAVPPASLVPVTAVMPALRQATLLVAKMDCPPCVAHLHSLLAHKPFIVRSTVVLGDEQVTVVYDSRQVDAPKLLALIPQSYEAVLRDDGLVR